MFLGLDIGTSGVKAVVLSDSGRLVAECHAPLSVSRPHPLWSEQNPDDWVAACHAAVLSIPADVRSKVVGVGLAGQMHGATLLGADDRPLRPAILWNDGRSFAECAYVEAAVPDSRAITGNIAMPGFTAPKLAWVRKHEPGVFAAVRTVLLPKDYVRLCLTGDKASDMADSAGTLWLDVGRRDWSDAMLAACGLTRDAMPRLYEGCAVTGTLLPAIAAHWGMDAVPVIAGGGDNAAGAIGVGVVADGDAFLSLGTSGVIFAATETFRPNPDSAVHAFCHALPNLWHQMSVHLSAASCVDWAVAALGFADVPAFFAAAERVSARADGPLFLPYLSGERTPHNDPHIRAAWLNMGHETGAAELAQAVLEGVAFAHADGLDALRAAGTHIPVLRVIGGGARSAYWGKILASVLETPLIYSKGGEVGPALGAARLAHIGVTGASASEVCTAPPVAFTIEPDATLTATLARKRALFKAAYPALKPLGDTQ